MQARALGPVARERVAVEGEGWTGAMSFDGTGRFVVMAQELEDRLCVVSLDGREQRTIEGVRTRHLLPVPGYAAVFGQSYKELWRIDCESGNAESVGVEPFCIDLDGQGNLIAIVTAHEAWPDRTGLASCRLWPDGKGVRDRTVLGEWDQDTLRHLWLGGSGRWLVWWRGSSLANRHEPGNYRAQALNIESEASFEVPEHEAGGGMITTARMDHRGTSLLLVKEGGRATIHDLRAGTIACRLESQELNDGAFTHDDRHLLSVADGRLRLWETAAWEAPPRELWVGPSRTGFAFDRSGQHVAVRVPGAVTVWALDDLLRLPIPSESSI